MVTGGARRKHSRISQRGICYPNKQEASRVVVVKARHAVALALVGWYLMVPPTPIRHPQPDANMPPISRWENRGSFDTAKECDSERWKKIMDWNYKNTVKDGDIDSVEGQLVAQYTLGQCIASDDPRLAK